MSPGGLCMSLHPSNWPRASLPQQCFHVPYSALTMFISTDQSERDSATAYSESLPHHLSPVHRGGLDRSAPSPPPQTPCTLWAPLFALLMCVPGKVGEANPPPAVSCLFDAGD